ncbi:MAG: hypothetical protein HY790_10765 [Deltaproteobacteria bacterium]|nr:hypothetical protein [Deltaproteobacteria bacterium]MBI4796296.1 hypothetical protein [Deltaproteobacteria bacterium]
MNPVKLLSQHTLKNGLVLEFWDLSRAVAGDRWQVVVEARVAVAVTPENLPPDLRPQSAQIITALGEESVFIKQEARNFVAASEMAAQLAQITEQLLSSLRGYLGHPEFAARFIRKKYADYQESQRY